MKLVINGEEREFPETTTLEEMMDQLSIKEKVMACAVNMNIVKKEEWGRFVPSEGDKVEMLHFVGGG